LLHLRYLYVPSFVVPSCTLSYFFFFLLLLRPPTSTLFPYTTLFRSWPLAAAVGVAVSAPAFAQSAVEEVVVTGRRLEETIPQERSEEHTSELQSRENLVCRLLLEKKKKKITNINKKTTQEELLIDKL